MEGLSRSIRGRNKQVANVTKQVLICLETSYSHHLGEGHEFWSWLKVGAGLCHMLPESSSSHHCLELPSMILGCQPHHQGGSRGHKEQANWAKQEQGRCLHSEELEV